MSDLIAVDESGVIVLWELEIDLDNGKRSILVWWDNVVYLGVISLFCDGGGNIYIFEQFELLLDKVSINFQVVLF